MRWGWRLVTVALVAACTSSPSNESTQTTADSDSAGSTTLVASTTVPPTSTTTVVAPRGHALVWHDEFDEPGPPNSANWRMEHSTFGDGNSELQCYEPAQVEVSDGMLNLTADNVQTTCPNGSTRQFVSGMVTSEGLQSFTSGVFEIRARVPKGQGLWPALWMSPEGDVYGRWPNSGEIDLMEIRGQDTATARVNLHYLGTDGRRAQDPAEVRTQPGRDFSDEFHVFGLIWDEDQMTWAIDGLVVHEVSGWQSQVGPSPAPFDQPFFFRLNLAVGGTFVGDPDDTTPWPATVEVDYVRVFQRQ